MEDQEAKQDRNSICLKNIQLGSRMHYSYKSVFILNEEIQRGQSCPLPTGQRVPILEPKEYPEE